jgi:hypothetical protein
MREVFYAVYNIADLSIISVGGAPFEDIPEGCDTCTVDEEEGEDFVLGYRAFHDYFIKDVNGHGVFKYKKSDQTSKRGILSNNIVRDLHYRTVFFDNLNISYTINDHTLTLNFDISKINELFEDIFKSVINSKTSDCILYLTEYQNPAALIEQQRFNLKELSTTNQISISVNTDANISVFAART